jgi:RNA polymerase sigma factor (sigma-70 family)
MGVFGCQLPPNEARYFNLNYRKMRTKDAVVRDQSSDSQTVYVVDDDHDVREGLDALLQSVGLKCKAFASTSEFLRNQLPDEPSCLVLDVRMPGLSGIDFQAELAGAKINIPIIFLTGHGDMPMSVKAMKAGAVEFLTKPVREQDLLDAVRVALDRDRAEREHDAKTRDLRARFNMLSQREQEIMRLVCAGLMNKQVAAEIGVSEVTVKVHRHNTMKKLGARSLAELVRMADSLGIRCGK